MIKTCGIFLLTIFVFSCNQTTTKNHNALNRNINTTKDKIDTSGLLENCDSLMHRSTIGLLQKKGVNEDSTGFFGFFDNYNKPRTYEIIFVYKGGVAKRKGIEGYDNIRPLFYKGCENNFVDFNCYAFVLPMRDPEKQDDVDAMNIDFPVRVKAYKRIGNDNWKLIDVLNVKDFDAYTTLQFKTIYDLNKPATANL